MFARSPVYILLFVLPLLVGHALAATRMGAALSLSPPFASHSFVFKLPPDLLGLLDFSFSLPAHFGSFRSPTHWNLGFPDSFLGL